MKSNREKFLELVSRDEETNTVERAKERIMMKKKESRAVRLDIEIRTNGSIYTLIRRSENVAMYKQVQGGDHVATEIGFIQTRPEETIKGVTYPFREVYFSNETFGVTSWSYGTRWTEEQLLEKFEELDSEILV